MISDGKSIEVRVDEDGGSDRGRDGIRWGKSDAVNQQRGNFDACATRRHSLQKRWMQELGKPSRITDGKPVAFSQDHLSHFCDRCFDLVGDRLHIPRPVPNLVKNSTSRVQLFECIENASRNLDDLCSPVSKGTCLLYEAGKDATRIKKNEFRNLRKDWEELQKKKKTEILSENDSVDVFGRCSMPFRWISTSLNKTISNSMLEIRECCLSSAKYEKKKNYVHCFVDRKFFRNFNREFESRENLRNVVFYLHGCPNSHRSNDYEIPSVERFETGKGWRYFSKIRTKGPSQR